MIKRRESFAFTLLELLVVIAILAVLVAILIPALNKSIQSARATICIHKLRDLSTVMARFRAERNQKMWNASDVAAGGEGSRAPVTIFYQYDTISSGTEMQCPSASTLQEGAWVTGGTVDANYAKNVAPVPISYAVNGMAFYVGTPWKMSTTTISSYTFFSGRESKVPLFMDGLAFQLNSTSWQPSTRFARISLRHNNRANVLFMDGHVEGLNHDGIANLDPYGGADPAWLRDFGPN